VHRGFLPPGRHRAADLSPLASALAFPGPTPLCREVAERTARTAGGHDRVQGQAGPNLEPPIAEDATETRYP